MRSFDYCHFEIVLGTSDPTDAAGIDALRKEAMRLADKAVAQYKVAKANAQRLLSEGRSREYLVARVEHTRTLPEDQRSPEQQAELKAFDDEQWEASRRYDYEDDWQDEDEEDF